MVAAHVLDGLIIRDPDLRGGRPVIANTGTTVRMTAGLYKLGCNAEEITGELPLTLAQVYVALTYYHLYTDEIESDIQVDSEAVLIAKHELNTGNRREVLHGLA